MKRRLTSEEGAKTPRAASFGLLLRLVSFVRPYCWPFMAALGALFVGSGINLLFPEVARRALDPAFFPTVLENLHLLTAGLAFLFVVQGAAFYIRSFLFGMIGQRVYADVRERMFRAVINREIRFFDTSRSGDLASRLNSDAALVQEAVSVKLSVILRYGLQVFLGVVLMAWMSWKMTGAILVSVLSMVMISSVFVKNLRRASRDYQGALARLSSFASECFGGARIIRSLAAQQSVQGEFGALNQGVLGAAERRVRWSAAFSSGASLVLNLLLLLVQWYGIHLVITSELPLNDLAAFVLYGAIVAVSFTFLVSAYAELMQSVGGLERVFELLDHLSSSNRDESEALYDVQPVEIVFDKISFAYPERGEVPVLNELDVRLTAGETTAVVGPSGAGKSSLVQLLLGFYAPLSGQIMVNGQPLQAVSEPMLRRLVAWVPQEPYLFGFTIYQNLVLGSRSSERVEVERIVSDWSFLKFISDLPQGLDTLLGEQGTQLSGGQRQRLAIARALLRRPAVLILDEATSGLDSETEEQVMDVIRAWLPNATVLIISHRLATVRAADSVYVLTQGRVEACGTHDQLRDSNGLYQQYVARQTLD